MKTKSNIRRTKYLVEAALIASLYVILTLMVHAVGLAGGAIQLRVSEALCVLPLFTPAAVPGLAVGCLLANIFTGCAPWDVVLGTLATLLGALGTRALRRMRFLAPLPPILANTLIIPFVLKYVYLDTSGTLAFFMLTVGIGEILSAGVCGTLLTFALYPHRYRIFGKGD